MIDSEEKLLALGNDYKAKNNLDEAIHSYNKVLKLNPKSLKAYLNLGDIYYLKCKTESSFCRLAMESYRKVTELDPSNEFAHLKLINIAVKTNSLGDLAVEYRQKLKKNEANKIYKKQLERVFVISILGRDVKVPGTKYEPSMLINFIFNWLFFPLILTLFFMPLINPKIPSMYKEAVGLLFFYCFYRIVVYSSNK